MVDNQFLRTDVSEGVGQDGVKNTPPAFSSDVPVQPVAGAPPEPPPTPVDNGPPTVFPAQNPFTPRTPTYTSSQNSSRAKPRRRLVVGLVLGALIIVGLITVFLMQRTRQTPLASRSAQSFNSNQSIPLASLAANGAITVSGKALNVNGQLRVNGSLIMTPAAQPALPSTGQIYYDQTSNHLKYFNGTEFVQIQTDKDATGTTAGNTLNNITNLSVTNNTVSTSSPNGGTTGKIAKFTSGQTLGDSILTDNNTFLSVNGGINLTAASSTSDLNFWPNNDTPGHIDTSDTNGSVDLGVKFQVDVPGTIKAVRFYKASADGSFVVSLWTSTGTLLAQKTVNATGTGWQTVTFTSPISVSPDTTYVASYHITSTPGNIIGYPFDAQYFGANGVDNGPLHALASGLDGGNGVFKYSNTPVMPTQTFNSTNYWVDAVFSGSQFTADSRVRINGAQLSSSDLANDGNIAKRGSAQVFSAHNIFRNASDSTDEFSVQRADTTQLLTVDSTNSRVYVGPIGANGSVLLVLSNRTNSGDPSNPTDGAMYYNAGDGAFRCYGSGEWTNCNDPQPTRQFSLYDEFMGGQTTSFGTNNIIGSLGWNAQAIGANGSINFNPTTPTPIADRPGVLVLQTPAVASQGTTLMLANGNGASMILGPGNVMRTAVAVGAASGQVLRVGLHNETSTTTQPVSGVWWEADPAANANWRYCYGNGTTATCTSSNVAIVANTWVRLAFTVNNVGNGTSVITFSINNSTFSANNVTVDSTSRVSPANTCYSTNGSAQTCYWDYFQLTGKTSTAR